MDRPPAYYFASVQDGKQEIYLEWPYAAFHGESNAIYRTLISQTVKEICTIIQKHVFCVHKPGFLMLGHTDNYIHAHIHT